MINASYLVVPKKKRITWEIKINKETIEILLTTMPLIKGGGTTTTMIGSKMLVPSIDNHLMVIKLNKAIHINLFIKTILLS